MYFLYPETRGVALEEMDKLFGDDVDDYEEADDDDDGNEADDEPDVDGVDELSETSSLVPSGPPTRKPSPSPHASSHGPRRAEPSSRSARSGLLGTLQNAFGMSRGKTSGKGGYDAINGEQ